MHVPNEIDIGRGAEACFHMRQCQTQRIDPHFPFESHFALSPRHKGQVHGRPSFPIEGVQDVKPIVSSGAIVQWRSEGPIQHQ